jgi:nucleotide-binding universal stress UspA family protein
MALPKNILVATDFSAGATSALDYAVDLASRLDARVHLVHAVMVSSSGYENGVDVALMIDSAYEGSVKALERLVAERSGRCAFGPIHVEVGDARAQIEIAVAKTRADLIVMGTHGRRGFKRLVLGSVAEAVVRHAPCPVLLVRDGVPT